MTVWDRIVPKSSGGRSQQSADRRQQCPIAASNWLSGEPMNALNLSACIRRHAHVAGRTEEHRRVSESSLRRTWRTL